MGAGIGRPQFGNVEDVVTRFTSPESTESTEEETADQSAATTESEGDQDVNADAQDSEDESTEDTEEETGDSEDTGSEEDTDTAPDVDATDTESETSDTLTAEEINELAGAYGDEFLSSPNIQAKIDAAVKARVDVSVRDNQQVVSDNQQTDALVQQGRTAIDGIRQAVKAAGEELGKASRSEDFQPTVMDDGSLTTHLSNYGSAIQADVARVFDTAIDVGFNEIFSELPELSETQVGELNDIRNTHNRMSGDPNQARAAEQWRVTQLARFVLGRAVELGATQERQRVEGKKTVAERITKKNAVKAAAAANARNGRKPPASGKSTPETTGQPSMELYRKLKAEGKTKEANDVALALSRR